MDYSLAALKLLCSQLKQAAEVPSRNSFTLGGLLFQRAWLQVSTSLHSYFLNAAVFIFSHFCLIAQGVLVSASDTGSLLLDDGTGLIELFLTGEFRQRSWQLGKLHLSAFHRLILNLYGSNSCRKQLVTLRLLHFDILI